MGSGLAALRRDRIGAGLLQRSSLGDCRRGADKLDSAILHLPHDLSRRDAEGKAENRNVRVENRLDLMLERRQ
jgi:hypothetical protein